MTEHVYSTDFYDYIDAGSRASADVVARLILGEIEVKSLLDIGSGHGAWAAEWMKAGVKDVLAVDGDYVRRDQLAIPADRFVAHDLATPLDLRRQFDLVQSLEVAEHLPGDCAPGFVDNLVRHGDVILFSAAVPHQGGEHHVNEQPRRYWIARMKALGWDYDRRTTGALENSFLAQRDRLPWSWMYHNLCVYRPRERGFAR